MEEPITEMGIGFDESGNVMITIGHGQLHYPWCICTWGAFNTLREMLNTFYEKHQIPIPKPFTNAFNNGSK